jgi:aryl-alcohol dehydrogenase-like predicted oxidoreductase
MDNLFSKAINGLGLGTWQMGMKGWGKEYEEEQLIDAFLMGINGGLNFIDTAELYGRGKSEEMIGKAIRQVERRKIFIATKVAGFNATAKRVRRSLEGSLKRLGTDYVDLYQVHWEPSAYTDIPALFQELEKIAKEGLIEHIGVSNFSANGIGSANSSLKDYRIESNQIKFNLIERPPSSLTSFMKQNDIKLIAWSPLAQGFLTAKYSETRKPSGGVRKVNRLFSDSNFSRYSPLLNKLKDIANLKGITVTQLVLAYEMRLQVLPIPGFKNKAQVSEILNSLNVDISNGEIQDLEQTISNCGLIEASGNFYPRLLPNFIARIGSLFI